MMQHKGRMQAGFRKQASLSTNAETGYVRSSYTEPECYGTAGSRCDGA